MPNIKNLFNVHAYKYYLAQRLGGDRDALDIPAGHFYSPLLDKTQLEASAAHMPFDGVEMWEHIDLRENEQKAFYAELLQQFPPLPFPRQKTPEHRYFADNPFFRSADAFTLSALIRQAKPARIVEVGSGFSSAVMLDTLKFSGQKAALTFIEPFPERLYSLLSDEDKRATTIYEKVVQEVPMSVFTALQERDILFIDSSHVAKIGSDVTVLLLRILPKLNPGVLVHVHDIVYPFSYPADWIREGRSWNESLFLRAFLIGNPDFQIAAFNSYIATTHPEVFQDAFPAFVTDPGGSIWLRKVA